MAVAPPEGEETGAKKKIKFQAEKNYYRLSQGEAQVWEAGHEPWSLQEDG